LERWYLARSPQLLAQMAQEQNLTWTAIALEAGVSKSHIGDVLKGRKKCQHAVALSIVRQVTGHPAAQEVVQLFRPGMLMPGRAFRDIPAQSRQASPAEGVAV
jgi:hypothetical protein